MLSDDCQGLYNNFNIIVSPIKQTLTCATTHNSKRKTIPNTPILQIPYYLHDFCISVGNKQLLSEYLLAVFDMTPKVNTLF